MGSFVRIGEALNRLERARTREAAAWATSRLNERTSVEFRVHRVVREVTRNREHATCPRARAGPVGLSSRSVKIKLGLERERAPTEWRVRIVRVRRSRQNLAGVVVALAAIAGVVVIIGRSGAPGDHARTIEDSGRGLAPAVWACAVFHRLPRANSAVMRAVGALVISRTLSLENNTRQIFILLHK